LKLVATSLVVAVTITSGINEALARAIVLTVNDSLQCNAANQQ